MNSDQYTNDAFDNVYLIVAAGGGLYLNKYNSSGVYQSGGVIDSAGYSPSIAYDIVEDRIYVCYVKNGTSPIGRQFVFRKYDPSDITSSLWSTTYDFYTPIDGTNPKLITSWGNTNVASARVVRVGFVNQDNSVSILSIEPSDGSISKRFDTGYITSDPNELRLISSKFSMYLCLQKETSKVQVVRYNAGNYARNWVVDIDGGLTNNKSNILLVEDTSASLTYVFYRDGTTSFKLTSLNSKGIVNWNSGIISITNSIGNRVHNMYLFDDTPMLSFIRTTGYVSFTKLSTGDGSILPPARETLLSGFSSGNLSSSYPLVVSSLPWDKVYVGYVNTSSVAVLSTYTSSLTSVISEPTSELSQYQMCSSSDMNINYLIYRNVSNGGIYIMSSTSTNTLVYDTLVANDGQLPGLVCSGSNLYYIYLRFLTSFSEYMEITITKVSIFDVSTPIWTNVTSIPVTNLSGIKPRILSTGNRVSCCFGNSEGYVIIRNINANNGSLIKQSNVGIRSGNKSEIAIYQPSSTSSILLATPSYSDTKKIITSTINQNSLTVQFSLEYTVSSSALSSVFVSGSTASSTYYVVAKDLSNVFYVSGIDVTGNGLVNSYVNNMNVTNALYNRLVGCYIFTDYLLAFYLNSVTTSLVGVKVTTNGFISSKTTSGIYLSQSPVIGDICLTSSGVFDKYFIAGYNSVNVGSDPASFNVEYVSASSGGLKVLGGTVTSTYGSNSILEQSSYQHCIRGDVQYVISRVPTGVKITSYDIDSTQINFADIDVNGYHPSIVCSEDSIYYSYLTLRTTLTNYVEFITVKLRGGVNTDNTVNVVWSNTITFPDDTLDTFFPRLILVDGFLNTLYVRNNDEVYNYSYNSTSGRPRTTLPVSLDLTVKTTDKREFRSILSEYANDNVYYVHLAFPEVTLGNINVSRYSSKIERIWNKSLNGGLTEIKSNLIIKEEYLTRSLVLAYTNNSSTPTYRVSVLDTNGDISFDGTNSTLSNLLFNRLSAMYVFDEYILLFGIKPNSSIDSIKILLNTGNVVGTPKNTVVSGFSVSGLTYPNSFLTGDPWNRVNLSYVSSSNILVVQTLLATTGSSITITSTELSEYQSVVDNEDSIYTVYYNSTEGVSVSKFSSNGTNIQRSIDANGQTPSIHCLPNDDYIYLSYVKNIDAFTSYISVSVKKLSRTDLSEVWSRNKLFVDPSPNNFRPRVQVSESGIVCAVYRNSSNKILFHTYLTSNGTLTGFIDTGYTIYSAADPTELAVNAMDSKLYVSYPESEYSVGTLDINVSTKAFSRIITSQTMDDPTGAKSKITVRYSSKYGIYLTMLSGSNIKLGLFTLSGTLNWQKTVTGFTNLYGPMIHAFYLTGGFPILFGLDDTTGNLTIRKYDNLGNSISTRTKNLETFDPKLFIYPPVILSRPTWETIWLIDFQPGLPLYSNWLIIVNKLNAALTPDPTEFSVQLSNNQYVIDSNDNIYLSYIQEYKPEVTTIPPTTPDHWFNDYGIVSLLTSYSNNGIRLRATYLREESVYGPEYSRIKMEFENQSGFGELTRLTSSTSNAFTNGIKTFVVNIPTETVVSQITPNKRIKIWVNGDPESYIEGDVVSLVGTTLTVTIDEFVGTGTESDWIIELTGFIYDIRIESTTIPSGMTFYGFNTIPILAPNEVYETYINVDFNNNAFDPIVLNLEMNIGTFPVNLYTPTSDLFYRSNGPNVISINKLNSSGVVTQTADIDVGGQSPALYNDNGDVYMTFVKKLVGFTDFVSLSVRKMNSTFDILWLYNVNFEDSSIGYFSPRIEKTSKGIHVCYFKQDGILYIDTLDSNTGLQIGSTYNTSISASLENVTKLATYSTSGYLYIALPGINGTITLFKYDMTGLGSLVWNVTFNGGTTTDKTNLIIESSRNDLYVPDEILYISYTDNMSTVTLTSIGSDSTVLWSKDSGLSMLDVFGNRVHGMFVYGGFPILLFVRNRTTYVSCTSVKYDEEGNVIDTIDIAAPVELEPGLILSNPVLLTRSPWETIFVEFYTNTYIENIESTPTTRPVVVSIDTPYTFNITVPESELSGYQVGKLDTGETFVVYSSDGVKLMKIGSNGSLLSNIMVDDHGQSPCLIIRSNRVYVAYMRYQAAFVGSSAHVVKTYDTATLSLVSVSENEYPDPQTSVFRPRLSVSENYIYSSYVRQDKYLYVERISLTTNSTDLVLRTSFDLSSIDPLSIVSYSGPEEFNLAYSLGGDTYIYNYDESLTQTWSQTLGVPTTDLILRYYLGTYLGYKESSGALKLVKFDSMTGIVDWTYNYGTPNYVGNRIQSLYTLFSYPITFNVNTSGEVNVTKLNEEGQMVSSNNTSLPGINISEFTSNPVHVASSPWDNLTLVYYTSFGNGIVDVSGSKAIGVDNYTATIVNPTPLPVTEVSQNQMDTDGGNHTFMITSDDTNGLLVTRHLRTTGAVTHSYLITAQKPFSPCLRYHNNRVYISYCVYSIGYTDIVEMFIDILNSSDLSLIVSTSRGLPDPQPDTFRPRITVSGNYLQRVFVRYSNDISIDRFDLSTYEMSDIYNTGVSYLGGDNRYITINGHDNVFELSYPLLTDPTRISVMRLDETDYTTAVWSNQTIDGGLSESKTYPVMRVNNEGEVYVSYTSASNKCLLTKLSNDDGSVVWDRIVINESSDRVSHGMDIFNGFPMVYTLRSNDNIVFSKFNEEGVKVSDRTTSLTGFGYSINVTGVSPYIVSVYPWDYIFVIHNTNNTALYYQPGRNVANRIYSSPAVYVLPPNNNDIETSQGVYEDDGTSQVVSYTSSSGTSVYYFNGNVISGTRNISNIMYKPSITKLRADMESYITYMKSFNTFTEVNIVGLRKLNYLSANSDVWVNENLILPDGSSASFKPYVKVYSDRLFLVYVRENGFIVVETYNKTSGDFIDRITTTHNVPNPSNLVIDGDYDLCMAYLSGGNEITVIKFNTQDGEFEEMWSSTTTGSSSFEKRRVEIIQNISERIVIAYTGYNPSTNLLDAFVGTINQFTGEFIWSLPAFTNMPLTEKLTSINYEGSFVSTSRVGLQLLDTDPSTIDIKVFSANSLGNVTKKFDNSLPSGTPLYSGNPLIMFNNGEGWIIMAYRDTSGTFRMLKYQLFEGSTRVEFNSVGHCITPGYDFWWRPLITINPVTSGLDVEEKTLTSGKLEGVYRKWFSNGHLQTDAVYNAGKPVTSKFFTKNGQWHRYTVSHTGISTYQEFNLPGRANLLEIFDGFDSNNDGFITPAEMKSGIESYGITIPNEELDLLVLRADKDEDGNLNYEEFARILPINLYTSPITNKIGFDSAIKTLECSILNDKKNGLCTKYASVLPAGQVIETSNYSDGKLNGVVNSYHDDGSLFRTTTYSSGKITGIVYEYYDNKYSNSLKSTTGYSPPGTLDNNYTLYNPAGWPELIKQPFIIPNIPTIRFRTTAYWSATQIKSRYYADKNYSKTNAYIEYYESGAVKFTGTYIRDLKNGLWTEFYETPNVKRIESNYVSNRLSGIGAVKTYTVTGILLESVDYPVYVP